MIGRCSASVLLIASVFLYPSASAAPEPLGKGLPRAQRFIPSTSRFPWANLLASKSSAQPMVGQDPFRATDIGRPKRASFDDSCKGAYDRNIFEKLDRLCEDCYNLYRKAYISYECRKDCFSNPRFEMCIYDLMLEPLVNEYAGMVQIMGKKK